MAEQDLTSEEEIETSEETAEKKETSQEETQKETSESEAEKKEIRYKAQKAENIRLKKETEKLQQQVKVFQDKPDISNIDKVIEQKIQERIAPLEAQASKDAVDKFLSNNPGATDHLEKINELLPSSYGKTVSEKLENAYLIASKDSAKNAGKTEMAFALHQQRQAVASGGGASTSISEGSLPPLTEAQREVARKMGVSEEKYAARLAEKK